MKPPFSWAAKDNRVSVEDAPAGTTILRQDLGPRPGSVAVYTLIASIGIAFVITWLDAVFSDPGLRTFITQLLNWASLHGSNYVPDGFWEPVTCMWLHGSWLHVSANMVGLFTLWTFFRNAVSARWWLAIFVVGGALANMSYLETRSVIDFSYIHSPVISVFWLPGQPMAGASGGVFALWGASIAFCLRYRLERNTGLVNRMLLHGWEFAIPAVIQLKFIDPNIAGVAWQAHLAGLIIGFVLGFVPPIYGNLTITATRRHIVGIKSVLLGGRQNLPFNVELFWAPSFDSSRDAVVSIIERRCLLWKSRPLTTVLAGSTAPNAVPSCTVADSRSVPGLDLWKLRGEATGHPGVTPWIA